MQANKIQFNKPFNTLMAMQNYFKLTSKDISNKPISNETISNQFPINNSKSIFNQPAEAQLTANLTE